MLSFHTLAEVPTDSTTWPKEAECPSCREYHASWCLYETHRSLCASNGSRTERLEKGQCAAKVTLETNVPSSKRSNIRWGVPTPIGILIAWMSDGWIMSRKIWSNIPCLFASIHSFLDLDMLCEQLRYCTFFWRKRSQRSICGQKMYLIQSNNDQPCHVCCSQSRRSNDNRMRAAFVFRGHVQSLFWFGEVL